MPALPIQLIISGFCRRAAPILIILAPAPRLASTGASSVYDGLSLLRAEAIRRVLPASGAGDDSS